MLTVPANAVSVAREGTFYAPTFEVRLKAAETTAPSKKLPPDVVRDVMQVTYKDSVNEIDSLELTINNWDAQARAFKYTGSEGSVGGDERRSRFLGLFDPGQELELAMGYGGNLRLMITGQITTLEPNFPASGSPTLAVRGLNVLHQLRRKQYTDYWPKDGQSEVRDSDIAQEIGQKTEDGKKRFPLPIRINSEARYAEPNEHHVMQTNQYDIVFLLARARQHGYVVLVEEFQDRGKPQKRLYFGPSEGKAPGERNVTYVLKWGESLVQFRPTLTTAKQVGSVTVRGWDRKAKQPIEVTVKWEDIGINRDLGDIEQAFNQREEVVADRPVYSQAQAKALAADILKNQLKEMVKGSGATVGLPDLRAGRRVFIDGLGDRFSGTYFVTETTHTINDGGYTTSFSARREQEGGAS
jgi:phage protein D